MIIVDTREQKWDHIKKYFDKIGMVKGKDYDKSKLYVGDFTLAHNMQVTIDRKGGLFEVCSNLCQQHERFRAECERAKEAGIKLIILVEEKSISCLADVANWQNPRLANWMFTHNAQKRGKMMYKKINKQPPINGERLHKMMVTMEERYGIQWLFCNKKETGKLIIELLANEK